MVKFARAIGREKKGVVIYEPLGMLNSQPQ